MAVWAQLLPILCAAKKVTLKEAADGIQGVTYRRLLAIKQGAVKELGHQEAVAILQYFSPVVVHLQFFGRFSRVEIDRRGKRW